DGPEVKLGKLEALLAAGTRDALEVMPLVAALMSIPAEGRYPALALTPETRKQRTLEILVDGLEGLASQRPVVAVYEDVHWIDPSTLDLLDLVVERVASLPVMAVVTFRPEFVPRWAGRNHVTSLALGRLGRRQGASIIKGVAGGKTLPAEVLDQIVTKTDG